MRITTITNLKGGTGKSTLTTNLPGVLLERGKRVLLVDLDKQASLTSTFTSPETYNPDNGPGMYQALMNGKSFREIIQHVEIPCPGPGDRVDTLALLPAEWDLILLDKNLSNDPNAMFDLADRLEELSGDYDNCLIDTPPDLRLETRMALAASHDYLTPINPDELAVKGIMMLELEAEKLRRKINPKLRFLGYVFNAVQTNRRHMEENIREYRERLGDRILKTEIRQSIKYAEARSEQKPITHYQPKSEWADLIRQLAQEIDL